MDALTPTADLLEARYREIAETRMQGIPILNGALAVKALGMRVWGDHMLCVLLTPWFMNVVLLAREDETENRPAGSKQTFAFPAGSFEFILGREEGIGPHWMCSLFSPVLEFADQETAEAAALAAIDELFSDGEEPDEAEREMDMIWRGGLPVVPLEAVEEEGGDIDEELVDAGEQALDRRAFLTGNRKQTDVA